MRQRVERGDGGDRRTPVILLDEPMNGLDVGALQAFRSLLSSGELQEFGATIVLSSHQLEEIDQVATHIGILEPHRRSAVRRDARGTGEDAFPSNLLIKVDRRDDALAALQNAGFTVDSRQEHLTIHSATAEIAREANRILVMQGVGVYHLSIELATLERQFAKVLATTKVWERV